MTNRLPRDVLAKLRAIDTAISPEMVQESWALLTPFHEKLGYRAPRIERDLRYGEHERHRLDVHAPGKPGQPAPVLLFAHGGGFTGGDKHVPGTPAYDHVGAWAARRGWVAVTMTYRLAPEATWPSGAEDVSAAVGWVRANIRRFGGDAGRLVVSGHSAGAVHVASYLAGQGGGSPDGVKGAALLSGIYVLRDPEPDEPEHAYYGPHPGENTSTLPALAESPVPLLFSVAELDPPLFHSQAAGVVSAWQARHGRVPNLVFAQGHNHISEIASLGVDDDALGVALARFVEGVTTS